MNKKKSHTYGPCGEGDYSSFPKYEILTFVTTQINLENVILSETRQETHVLMWDLEMLNWEVEVLSRAEECAGKLWNVDQMV